MHLLILGSTGPTGRLLTARAVARGHAVRVLVRDPSADLVPGTEVLQGDARSPATVGTAMTGMGATISALGMGLKTAPDGLMIDATRALIAGADSSGDDRVVMLSSWGVGDTLRRASPLVRLLYRAGKKVHDEKAAAEVLLRASPVDWTLVYPVMLTDRAATGRTIARDLDDVTRLTGVPRIGRADVAEHLLLIAEQDTWRRRTVVLTPTRRR